MRLAQRSWRQCSITGAASVALRGDATPDVSWLITMCERMLNGERTYDAWGDGNAEERALADSLAKGSYPILCYPSRLVSVDFHDHLPSGAASLYRPLPAGAITAGLLGLSAGTRRYCAGWAFLATFSLPHRLSHR